MQFLKVAGLAMSALALASLSACGGGSDDGSQTPRAVQGVIAPANTLVLTAGTTSFPKGSYSLDTGYANASGVVTTSTHVIEWVWPESNAFDSGIFFAQDDPRKFAIGLTDQPPAYTAYRCVSVAWTADELLELATLFEDPDLPSVRKCPSGITIDAAGHHVSFSDWTLLSDDGTQSVKFSVNVSWLLQDGTLSSGGGSGSGSSDGGTSSSAITVPSGSVISAH